MVSNKQPKLLVTPYHSRKKAEKEAVKLGKEILTKYKEDEILVKYRGKRCCMLKLLQHLARRVLELERNQCKPKTSCLFKAQAYHDEKYLGKKK